jgi:hypothetical protein
MKAHMRLVKSVRRAGSLVLAALAVATGTSVAAVPVAPRPAWAADPTDSLSIEGDGLSEPIVVRPVSRGDLFSLLLAHVSGMVTGAGDVMTVDRGGLGPRYTVMLWVRTTPAHTLDVYPVASGGPRGHRPAASRPAKVTEAWFYAPVDLPYLLRLTGVPLLVHGVGYVDAAGCRPVRTPGAGVLSPPTSGPFWGQALQMVLASGSAGVFVLLLLFIMIRFGAADDRRRGVRPSFSTVDGPGAGFPFTSGDR